MAERLWKKFVNRETVGVAFWKLGFERAVTWTTIADAVRGW